MAKKKTNKRINKQKKRIKKDLLKIGKITIILTRSGSKYLERTDAEIKLRNVSAKELMATGKQLIRMAYNKK